MKRILLILTFALATILIHAQRTAFIATTTDYGQLKTVLGEKAEEIDSLVIEGPINAVDFSVIWECAYYGKLQALNLEKAEIEGGRIPDEALFNREVQSIDDLNFWTTGLREVILPEGITEIGKGAFRCSEIIKINLPTTLRKLGQSCFYLCDYLNPCPLVIPEGIEEIPGDCFRGCHQLTEVVLPNSLKFIQRCAFYGDWEMCCNFPENLEGIADFAFSEVCGLKTVHLPKNCLALGEACFDTCENIEEFTFPDGIKYIPSFCLTLALSLKEITIPSSVRSIGGQAFCQTALTNIVVPEGVETIGDQAFAHNNLETVTLPSTLKYIGGQAFRSLYSTFDKITSHATTPAVCGTLFNEWPFRPNAAPLYVPKGTSDLYRAADGWNVLTEIFEMDNETSVQVPVSTNANRQEIYNLRGEIISSLTVQGVFIRNGKKYLNK